MVRATWGPLTVEGPPNERLWQLMAPEVGGVGMRGRVRAGKVLSAESKLGGSVFGVPPSLQEAEVPEGDLSKASGTEMTAGTGM